MSQRVRDRIAIRSATEDAVQVAKKGNAGPSITDALFFEQLILAVCNLAETLDAVGAADRGVLHVEHER